MLHLKIDKTNFFSPTFDLLMLCCVPVLEVCLDHPLGDLEVKAKISFLLKDLIKTMCVVKSCK